MPDPKPRAGPRVWIAALGLALATAALYVPVLDHDFIAYDTPDYVLDNPNVRDGLSLEAVVWALGALRSANWHPLAWISHMVDCSLFGLEPGGHHAVSAGLHALSSALLLAVLYSLTGALGRSAFVAAVFALHPLRLESVAWVAERKDVLSGLFSIAVLGAYARYARAPGAGRYAGVAGLFALALAAKPMAMTLPCVLLMLDLWPLRRLALGPRRLVVEKLPLFAMGVAVALVTVVAQRYGGALRFDVSPLLTVSHAIVAYALYLWKLVWPVELAVFYPHPGAPAPATLAACSVLLGAVTAFAARRVRTEPYLAVGWLWFVVMLLPVIGVLQLGSQSMADRYTYLPAIGVAIAVTWGAGDLAARFRYGSAAASAVALAAIVGLAWGTSVQLGYWRDTETLFARALEVTERNAVAHHLVGAGMFRRGELDAALEHLGVASRIRPQDPQIRGHLGAALLARNDVAGAAVQLGEALRLDPENRQARFHMAVLAERQGRSDEAFATYDALLAEQPGHPGAHRRTGLRHQRRGELSLAEWHLRIAARNEPRLAANHVLLGRVLEARGRAVDALAAYRTALDGAPNLPVPLRRTAWLRATHADAALRDAAEAVAAAERLNQLTGHRRPADLDILAAAYAEAGHFDRATATATRALRLAAGASAELRAALERRRDLYAAGQPYRDSR